LIRIGSLKPGEFAEHRSFERFGWREDFVEASIPRVARLIGDDDTPS
jgi:hypothetical protein